VTSSGLPSGKHTPAGADIPLQRFASHRMRYQSLASEDPERSTRVVGSGQETEFHLQDDDYEDVDDSLPVSSIWIRTKPTSQQDHSIAVNR
jgi:hypothetical protein